MATRKANAMDSNEARTILRTTERDYTQTQRFLRGLQIFATYDPDLDMNITFTHGQMWATGFENSVALMSREEVTELAALGWFEDNDY